MATFPIDDKTEILYPHKQELKTNWASQRTDDNRWRAGFITNGATLVRRTANVGFRVQRDSFDTMMTFIQTNIATTMTLTKTGTDFFLNGNTSNTVYILDYQSFREKDDWYRIDVRFLLQ